MAKQGVTMKYDKIHKRARRGELRPRRQRGRVRREAHVAFYDLFRVENGKIAEHWDTIETIPAEDWKNDNGKF